MSRMIKRSFMRGAAAAAVLVLTASACEEREDVTPDTMRGDTLAARRTPVSDTRRDSAMAMGRDSAMQGGAMAGGAMQVRTVSTADKAPYGKYLTDGNGRALYVFTADTKGKSSACYDQCATAWPPVKGDPKAIDAGTLDKTKLGSIQRSDGTSQLTFNGWPLYYFQKDGSSRDVMGQDVHSFDGEWYLVSPTGEMNKAKA